MAKRTARGSGNNLEGLSLADLEREIQRRKRGMAGLLRRRERTAAKLRDLDALISSMGGSPGRAPGARTRPKNETNLVDALAAALKGKTMGVTEAAEAVQKAGYRTSAANFRVIVNQTLINSGKFKRVERGMYTAK
jgi:hypothetical protein